MHKIQILSGDDALHVIVTPDFKQKWQELYRCCRWATVCQSPEFVLTWYEVYRAQYSPVVALALSATGDLVGLFPLAISNSGKALVIAGARAAEYHCWLERPETECWFMKAVLPDIFRLYPRCDISLKYLAPGAPDSWLPACRTLQIPYTVISHQRPLMSTDEASVAKQMARKSIKRKLNSLRRAGNVTFERVQSTEFVDLFDEICEQCDQRQNSVRAVTPFRSDPLRRQFFLALNNLGLIHTTVLRVNGRIAASHTGIKCKDSLQLTIMTHASEIEQCSPGAVHIVMLAAQLRSEGISIFDLTPGGDAYKESFATSHETVMEIKLFGSRSSYYRSCTGAVCVRILKKGFTTAGIEPAKVRREWNKIRRFLTSVAGIAKGRRPVANYYDS